MAEFDSVHKSAPCSDVYGPLVAGGAVDAVTIGKHASIGAQRCVALRVMRPARTAAALLGWAVLSLVVAVANSAGGGAARPPQPLVLTREGRLLGVRTSFEGRPLHAFYGVPYARPPLGRLRFLPPVAVTPWRHVWSARRFKGPCMQRLDEVHYPVHLKMLQNASEDCLYLNVWTAVPDQQKVTLLGLSSGAASGGLHMTAPQSRGLFHAAILEGGGPLCDAFVEPPRRSLERANHLAGLLSCSRMGAELENLPRQASSSVSDAGYPNYFGDVAQVTQVVTQACLARPNTRLCRYLSVCRREAPETIVRTGLPKKGDPIPGVPGSAVGGCSSSREPRSNVAEVDGYTLGCQRHEPVRTSMGPVASTKLVLQPSFPRATSIIPAWRHFSSDQTSSDAPQGLVPFGPVGEHRPLLFLLCPTPVTYDIYLCSFVCGPAESKMLMGAPLEFR
ncbi:uncharacterized protein LOC142559887 [Dermacentor variabilis]|uniref:uncharacterized protein LOC142559887 n=1 Tax=Dermacentor variabilis TaxID=34621 RepID=UPI003F5B17F7